MWRAPALKANPHYSPPAPQRGSAKQNKTKTSVRENSLISVRSDFNSSWGWAAMEETPTLSPSPVPTPPHPPGTNCWDLKHSRESRQAFEAHFLQLARPLFSANISTIKIVTLLPVCFLPFAHGLVKMLGKYCLLPGRGTCQGDTGLWLFGMGRDGAACADEPFLTTRESLALGNRNGHICQIFSLA